MNRDRMGPTDILMYNELAGMIKQVDMKVTVIENQIHTLIKIVGYLASYTVDDEYVEEVKEYITHQKEQDRWLEGNPAKDPEFAAKQARCLVWSSVLKELEND